MSQLSNKVAIITGASSGIGRASAILFAREGARVVLGARRQPELDLLVEEIREFGGQAVSLAGDVKSESYARALVELAVGRFGGLDIAFNNAGTTGTPGSVQEMALAQWHETLDTNLTSAFVGAGGHRHPHGTGLYRYAGKPRLCAAYACPQTAGPTGGDRPLGPLSRVRCIELYHRHCPAGRWWGIYLSHMTLSHPRSCGCKPIVRAPYV
jgi:hypothetical protein